jgi:hypothetical protein
MVSDRGFRYIRFEGRVGQTTTNPRDPNNPQIVKDPVTGESWWVKDTFKYEISDAEADQHLTARMLAFEPVLTEKFALEQRKRGRYVEAGALNLHKAKGWRKITNCFKCGRLIDSRYQFRCPFCGGSICGFCATCLCTFGKFPDKPGSQRFPLANLPPVTGTKEKLVVADGEKHFLSITDAREFAKANPGATLTRGNDDRTWIVRLSSE